MSQPRRSADDLETTQRIADGDAWGRLREALTAQTTDFAIVVMDAEGVIRDWNPGAERILGYAPAEIVGRPAAAIFTDEDRAGGVPERELTRAEREGRAEDTRWHQRRDGTRVWVTGAATALRGSAGELLGFGKIFRDATGQRHAEQLLVTRAEQQAAVARLGLLVLETAELQPVLDAAVRSVAEVLGTELSAIFELLSEGAALRLRAGLGWREGCVGTAAIPTGHRSQAGYVLATDEAVVAEDLAHETRFQPSSLLLEHAARSGVSVVIRALGAPWGALSAYSPRARSFTPRDVDFLQAVANIVGLAIERARLLAALDEERGRLRTVIEQAPVGMIVVAAPDGRIVLSNAEAERVLGHPVPPTTEVAGYAAYGGLHDDGSPYAATEHPTARALLHGETIRQWEMDYRRGDGTITRLSVSAAPVRDGEGRIVGAATAFQDVSAAREREAALQLRDRQLDLALRSSGVVLFAQDRELRYLWTLNSRLAPGARLLGRRADEFFERPEEAARVAELRRRVLETGTPARAELPVTHDGRTTIYDFIIEPLRDAEGAIVGIVGAGLDVTQRLGAEAAVRESEARYRAFVETMPKLAWRLRPDGVVEFFNRRWYAYTGQDEGALVDHRWAEAVHPDDRARLLAARERGLATGEAYELELRLRQHDGVYHWMAVSVAPLRDETGTITAWHGVALDIDDRMRMEEALRASEARYRTLFESIDEGFCVIEVLFDAHERPVDYRFLETNPAFVHQTDLADAVGRTIRELAPGHEAHWFEIYGRVALTGEPTRFEAPAEALGRWYDVYAFRIGEPHEHRVAVLFNDISERRRTEAALRETQKLESIGVLAAGIAHDFNNLLTGITGNLSLGLHTLSGEAALATAPLLEEALKASDRAADLVRQLLAYAGKGRFVIGPVDFCRLVTEVAGLFRHSVPKHVEVRFDLADRCPPVEADASQLQQLVMNLVLNAAEAIGDAPGTVTLRTSIEDLSAEDLRQGFAEWDLAPGRYLRFEVQDTGAGMDAETRAKIFDPFFTTKFLGRGLGLSAVQGIVRGHRGGLAIRSAPGFGTTFTVLLPLQHQVLAPPAAREAEAPRRGQGLVAVVDDEEAVREVARRALEEFGYTVLTATNGREAVALVAQHGAALELVLLDLAMPVMGGAEAIPRMRAHRPTLPIAIMTGYGDQPTLERIGDLGVAAVIQKPFRAEHLAEQVRGLLAQSRP